MSNTVRVSTLPPRRAGERFVQTRTFEWLSRGGFVARGFVYAIVGVLALKLAIGEGGKLVNQQGAFQTVAHQPFGSVLLTALAIGLGCYALWRLVRAAIGHGPEGVDRGVDRLAAFASGIVYAGLCVIAVRLLLGSTNTASPGKATGGVLGWPGGPWLVGLGGALFTGVALYQGYRAFTKDFLEDAKTEQMGPATRAWIGWIGSVGYLARMIVFGLVGVFLIKAAVEYDPQAAVGLDGALAKVVRQPAGPILLGLVAAGLIAFAIYSWSDARYRRI
jgi:Domain of Unknown Function (DUF1206)